jgi:AcrR family transcriptional regulator
MTATPRPDNRREQILTEAAGLFAREGFKGTSMRGIAHACGITEAAIYRHFEGKENLYEEVIRWKADQHDISHFLDSTDPALTIEELLRRLAEHILNYIDADPELLELMFNNSVEHGPAAAVLFKEVRLPYITFIAGEIKRRMASGEVRMVDPHITARCFVGMVMDCALTVGVWNKVTVFDFRARDVIRNNVPIFARGLATEAPRGEDGS